ncbi:MAG: tetratricopeptide repeat protein [Thiotrichales bacterium]
MQSTQFWLIAAFFAIAATVIVLLPLRRQRTGRSVGARVFLALAVLIPVAAFGVYAMVGNPGGSSERADEAVAAVVADTAEISHDLEALIEEQVQKLKADPSDAAGWAMLAVSYTALNRWPEAEAAYAEAYALEPEEAFILSGYAEAISVNAGRDMTGRPIELVRKALEIATQDEKALELAGIHAFQREEYGTAAYYWRQLLKVLPADGAYARDIRVAMREARQRSHLAGFESAEIEQELTRGTVSGTVVLAPAMQAQISGTEAVYLVARAEGIQLAAMRATADALPLGFTLDDSLAETPDKAISQRETLALSVWVSKSGANEPQAGDLEGQVESIKVGETGVTVVIDSVVR